MHLRHLALSLIVMAVVEEEEEERVEEEEEEKTQMTMMTKEWGKKILVNHFEIADGKI